MKRFWAVLFLAAFATATVCMPGCFFKKLFGNDLEKDGYVFNEEKNWYEKNVESGDGGESEGTYVNFTESAPEINQTYVIGPSQNRVVFIGNSSMEYNNFNIKAEGRYSPLYIELRNIKFIAGTGNAGIDARDVNSDYRVYVIASGASSVTGGNGADGSAGRSYDINNGASNPQNGEKGADGQNGLPAVYGNTVYLSAIQSSSLTLTGGNGGNGGTGGDGEGSAQKEIGQAGHGADGGDGGMGGSGLEAVKFLTVENNGDITLVGGNGGTGGNGGHGGHNKNTGTFDRADHAGHAGSGGNGGAGGYGIKLGDGGEVEKVKENFAEVYGGNGGTGGNGNDGGNSTKCEFQTSKGGRPGNAGSGGKGGNGGASAYNIDANLYIAHPGLGGKGGEKGNPGRNPSIGYGEAGADGANGESGRG